MSLISKDKIITDCANAYRVASGTSTGIKAGELADKLSELLSTGSNLVVTPIEITKNGTYTAPDGVDGYSPINVNVNTGLDYDMGEFVLDADTVFAKAVPHDFGSIPEFILVWTDDLAGTTNEFGKPTNVGFIWLKNITGLKQRLTSAVSATGYTINYYQDTNASILSTSVPTSKSYCHEESGYYDTNTTFVLHKQGSSSYWRSGITYKYFVSKAWWNIDLGGATNAE